MNSNVSGVGMGGVINTAAHSDVTAALTGRKPVVMMFYSHAGHGFNFTSDELMNINVDKKGKGRAGLEA